MKDLFPSRIAVVVLFLGLAGPVAAGPFEDGAIAVKASDYATLMRLWLPLAEQGQAWAQLNLGLMYDSGQGLRRDDVAAANWYRKAADQGNAKAQLNLGLMYLTGRGVPQGPAEEVKWLEKAADHGDRTPQWLLRLGIARRPIRGTRRLNRSLDSCINTLRAVVFHKTTWRRPSGIARPPSAATALLNTISGSST